MMLPDGTAHGRVWAVFFSREILGFIFFMAGVFKVFQMGPLTHAQNMFVVPYADTFLPIWALWFTGWLVPIVELIAGGLLILGLRTRDALVALGFVLVLVTFGHLLLEPLYAFNGHVIPRWMLLVVCFLLSDDDVLSIDYCLANRGK